MIVSVSGVIQSTIRMRNYDILRMVLKNILTALTIYNLTFTIRTYGVTTFGITYATIHLINT